MSSAKVSAGSQSRGIGRASRKVRASLVLTVSLSILSSACDKSAETESTDKATESKKAEPSDKTTADTDSTKAKPASKTAANEKGQEEKAKPALPPETPEQITEQCKGLLQKNWIAIQPALAKLTIEVTEGLKASYTESGYNSKRFLEACQLVSQTDRHCLTNANDPVAAERLCNIDSKKAGGKQFQAPRLPGKTEIGKTSGVGIATLSKLKGTWKNSDGLTTWKIASKGKTTVEKRKRDGTLKPKDSHSEVTISIDKEGAKRTYPKSNSQTLVLFMAEPRTFYASGNLNYGAYDMMDGKTYAARVESDWILFENGACEAVTFQGHVVPATCTEAEKDGKKYLDVQYQVPGKVAWNSTKPEPTKERFLIANNHLLSSKLQRLGTYVKQ